MTSTILRSYIGRRVQVFSMSQSGYKDEGVLRDVDEFVIRLEVGDPSKVTKPLEQYVFPLANVRLIRLLEV